MLPAGYQEQVVSVSYPRAMGSFIQTKIKEKMIFTMAWKATHGSRNVLFHKMPIDKATKNFRILQILQLVSFI
jgi:hypothetical protein